MGFEEEYNKALKRGLKMAVAKAVKRGSLPDISQEKPLTINQQLYGPISRERLLNYAFEDGFEEGFKETYDEKMHERCVNLIKNLLNDPKVKIDYIIKVTGWERDELMRLKAELEE
jgi:flagellar biosynthesis/type III secretory pathway protein FliH